MDVSEISQSLGGVTELVPLFRERQAHLSNYMTFHYIFSGELYACNNTLVYPMIIRTITGQLGYWGEERSLELGKKRGNSRGTGPAGNQAPVVLQLTCLRKGLSVFFEVLWRLL